MGYTCAQAAKLMKKLNEELTASRNREKKSCRFTAAVGEDPESARPDYDFHKEQLKQAEFEDRIRKIKHTINRFNLETEVPDFGMTIDELLVYIPQLSERKRKLILMTSYLPKERVSGASYGSKIIEYTYTNYEMTDAQQYLEEVTEELAKAQMALDLLNNQIVIEESPLY